MSPLSLIKVAATSAMASQAGIDPYAWYNIAGLLGGIGWLAVYVIAVYHGFKAKTCAIPAYAVCFNLGWEILTSFVIPNPIPVWLWINRGWFLLDVAIAVTLLRYGRTRPLSRSLSKHFYAILGCAFVVGIAGQLTYIRSFHDLMGYEVAFFIDLFMAIFFVLDYLEAPVHDDATFAIAWARLWGDLGVSIQCYYLFPRVDQAPAFGFFHFLFVTILALDCLYIYLLWEGRRASAPARSVPRLAAV
jgi:hypothetical protein